MKAIKIVNNSPLFSDCAEPRGTGVLVRVVSSSICGTDLHLLPTGMLEGRIWHQTGANLSEAPRAAAFAWYTKPIYRAQENWFLSLNDDVLASASDNLLTLLGYRTEVLGTVYGHSPR